MSGVLPVPPPAEGSKRIDRNEGAKSEGTRAYENPAAGLRAIRHYYDHWTGTLTTRSFELSITLIAANWAVFGSVDRVLNNFWAKGSILVLVLNVLTSLAGVLAMAWLHRRRWKEAEANPDQWERQWEQAAGTNDPWPFTPAIENLGVSLQVCRATLPLIGGLLFLVGLSTS